MYLGGVKMQAAYLLVIVATVISSEPLHHLKKRSESCILPPYPKNGAYEVAGSPSAQPGEDLDAAFLNVTCSPGYGVIGSNVVMCVNGEWTPMEIPQCVRFCHLPKHVSVEYHCFSSSGDSRKCNEYEPSGTSVRPQCKSPNYFNPTVLPYMKCIDGNWDYVAVCAPECGRIPESEKEPTLPWYATIYEMNGKASEKICAGSIISDNIIVTAAHCFWKNIDSKIRPSDFAVTVGKANNVLEGNNPKILVKDIKIPLRFRGTDTNLQDDIALIILSDAIEYSTHVSPVCLDFSYPFERRQFQEGNLGKLLAWTGPKKENSSPQVLELPYMTIADCLRKSPVDFKEFLTSDKFCAGLNGTSICRGNSGSGLSFAEEIRGVSRHYLRGVASITPSIEEDCTATELVAFTQVTLHEHFIKEYFV